MINKKMEYKRGKRMKNEYESIIIFVILVVFLFTMGTSLVKIIEHKDDVKIYKCNEIGLVFFDSYREGLFKQKQITCINESNKEIIKLRS